MLVNRYKYMGQQLSVCLLGMMRHVLQGESDPRLQSTLVSAPRTQALPPRSPLVVCSYTLISGLLDLILSTSPQPLHWPLPSNLQSSGPYYLYSIALAPAF